MFGKPKLTREGAAFSYIVFAKERIARRGDPHMKVMFTISNALFYNEVNESDEVKHFWFV